METPILSAKKIKKTFFTPSPLDLLKEINLDVFPKKTIAIVGRSGSGKSTLLSILGTLETPTSGELEIHGKRVELNQVDKIRNELIGFIFQSYHLLEEYTALENVLIPAKIARIDVKKGSKMHKRALELLGQVGCLDRANFLAKHLSGGEKQRVAIARALCNDPSLILADEPTGNLDDENSKKIHELLIHFAKELNKGLIIVTHNRDLAALCDQRFLLKNGLLECIQ